MLAGYLPQVVKMPVAIFYVMTPTKLSKSVELKPTMLKNVKLLFSTHAPMPYAQSFILTGLLSMVCRFCGQISTSHSLIWPSGRHRDSCLRPPVFCRRFRGKQHLLRFR
jgi:hypothetical protein